MFEKLKQSMIAKLILAIIIVWSVLAVIFGFTDLEISIVAVDENSSWGIFGRDYGEVPGYGLIAIALSTLIGSYNDNIRKQKTPAYVIMAIGFVIFILGIYFESQDLLLDGGVIFISLLLFVFLTYEKDWSLYRKIALIITLLAAINPLIFVQITKVLCGRVRFRDLAPGFTNYTPWFLPPGPISGGSSFPSGHTSMSFMFIPTLILVKDLKLKNPIKVMLALLIVGWAIFVGLSRIVIGAHYASDVLFSGGVAVLFTVLLYRRIYIKRKK
ncbi:MAG: phosphatase PAP2 family protein [Candidatus Thorarchaeota archaeon]